MSSVNKQVFDTSKENYKEHLNRFLETLLAYNIDFENDSYNDIHIYQEECLVIVEWTTIPYSGEWGGTFKFVNEDETIMREVNFPDGHYEFVFPEEVDETLKKWYEKHPEWVKTDYGIWTNVEENRISYIDMVIKDEFKNKETMFEIIKAKNLIKELTEDRRLHRTDYIVCNEKTASLLSSTLIKEWQGNRKDMPFDENADKEIYKAFILNLKLDEQQFDKDSPIKYYNNELPIYICKSLKDDEFALCLDSGYHWFYRIERK